jgi:endonuclease/exonuclease/phosphatase family metal-dependent hydrolase
MLKLKNFLFYFLLFIIGTNSIFAQQIKIITYNIRLDVAIDGLNQWGKRINSIDSLLKKYSPDVLCIQEGLYNQILDLQTMLPNYFYVGGGRDDGKEKGEFSAVFFKKNKFELVTSNTFWLSLTPEIVGSKGWDAAITRICSYGKVKLKNTNKSLYVFNTHFDHIGETARQESAKLILNKITEIAGNEAVILTGDFNSEPNSVAYNSITNFTNHPFKDSYTNSKNKDCTFTGFEVKSKICKRIDFIFYDKNFKLKNYQIINDNNGVFYPSDHLAVEAILEIK